MLETIENAIIYKLEATFKEYQIESFPADFDSYSFTSAKGCMLVRYDGSTYSKPQTLCVVTQDETYQFSVITGLRYLKKYNEAYPIVKQIKKILTGLNVSGKKLYPKKRSFLSKIGKDLYWGYVFSVTMPTQEEIDEDKIIPFWTN